MNILKTIMNASGGRAEQAGIECRHDRHTDGTRPQWVRHRS